jgi:Glycosyltransferase family 87
MHLFFNRPVPILLFAGLAILVTVRGFVPAVSKVDSDFPGYFTAAKIVVDGGDVERLYDDLWFQDQMRRYQIGRPSEGKFSPFPPPTALLLIPLVQLEPLNALRVVTGMSALGLVCAIVLLARILSWNLIDSAVFVLLSGNAVIGALRLGQPYILVSWSCVLGYYAYVKGRPVLAGVCFGVLSPIKYFPLVILTYFAFLKEWKLVLGGATAILTVALVSIGVLGWKIHEDFLSSVLGNHLIANMSMQDPFTASFQSFDTLFRRLFVFDATLNPQPWIALPRLHVIGVVITKAVIFLAGIATLVKLARNAAGNATAPSIGLLGVLTLLLAPATATYHFVLLWLPVGLLVDYFFRQSAGARAYVILGTYALIGFFPYRITMPFQGRGGLTVLAYPRLFLLLAMFTACVYFVWNRTEPVNAPD